MSRTRRATWNYLSSLLFTAVTLVVGLVATPFLVRWLGKGQFGAFRVLTDWAGYLALLELGVGGALQPMLAHALGRGDEPALARTLAAGVRAYVRTTLLCLAVGLGLALVVDRLVGVPAGFAADLRRAWIISATVGVLPFCFSPLKMLVDAQQRGYWISLLLTVQGLLITAMSLLLAWAGWGITGQALAVAVGVLPVPVVLAWAGLRRHPGLLRATLAARPDPETLRSLRSLSGPALAMTLCGRVGLLTDNIIVGRLIDLETVTLLVVTQKLVVMGQTQLQNIGAASWAGLAEMHAQGHRDLFNRRLIELTRLVAVLGVAGLAPVVAYNRHFIGLWMGPGNFAGEWVTVVGAINALLLASLSLWNWCFSGTGQLRRVVGAAAVGTAINLAASVLFTWRLGPVGPLLGTLVSFLAVNLWYMPLQLRRTFGTPLRPLALALGTPLAWCLPYAAALWGIARVHTPRGWPGLALEMGLAALGFLAFSYAVLLGPADRAAWRARLAGLSRLGGGRRGPVGAVAAAIDGDATGAEEPAVLSP
jgi:O-antigen/teichoic acid export membrane protein